ncbi:MAG: YtxH domain-containing protein [Bacteroidetes bacterium]|nr:YtxH domain-containing protein [Bacteroidota bacterium]
MNSGKVVLGLLAGLAAGALLGVLFAPDQGSVTRKKILKKGENYADGLKEKLDEFVEVINKKVKEVKEEFEEANAEEIRKDRKPVSN